MAPWPRWFDKLDSDENKEENKTLEPMYFIFFFFQYINKKSHESR